MHIHVRRIFVPISGPGLLCQNLARCMYSIYGNGYMYGDFRLAYELSARPNDVEVHAH